MLLSSIITCGWTDMVPGEQILSEVAVEIPPNRVNMVGVILRFVELNRRMWTTECGNNALSFPSRPNSHANQMLFPALRISSSCICATDSGML